MADIVITAANVVPSAKARIWREVAGVAIAAGQVIYRDPEDGHKAKLADANSGSAPARAPEGMAINSAAAGQEVSYVKEDAELTLGAVVSNGTVYVLSATPGGVAPAGDLAAGWYPCVLAVGISATKVAFRAEGLRSSAALAV